MMSRAQRDKGKRGEIEVVHILRDVLGVDCRRNLVQTREGGCDIVLEPYRIEVKRRARIGGLYEWMEQAEAACDGGGRPLVVCRADGERWLAVMPMEEALKLIREEVVVPGGG